MKLPHQLYRQELDKLFNFLANSSNRTVVIKSEKQELRGKYDYIILDNFIGDLRDVQKFLENLKKYTNPETRLVVTYYNHIWEPILKLATTLGWRLKVREQNWLDNQDIANLLNLAGYEVITKQKRFLLPIDLPVITSATNRWLAQLPMINELCLITWVVARPKLQPVRQYSVSIVVPVRNESGNIDRLIRSLPKFGKWQEVIFVEGHSRDDTWEKIQTVVKEGHSHFRLRAYKQKGRGKADAVRLGFDMARGQVLMILDGDLTVAPEELPKFYKVIEQGEGEFVNGCRLVYPMEKDAMRTLNKIGNKGFSVIFTWVLGQRFKDTLCGTKVLLRSEYHKIATNRDFFGDFDPFGDYDLIFGAVKQNMKVVEMPIRYRERTYGSTNISRFRHGWLLLKMTWFAYGKLKAW